MSTTSPNMSLVVPTVAVDTGLIWEQSIQADLGILDSHNHSPGYGAQITPEGLDINSDLTFQDNNATTLRAVRYQTNITPIAAISPDLIESYAGGSNGDLYWNDAVGNQIRITQGGAVAGASGTITGLPSGTASASFNSITDTFIFQQSTNTGANLDIGTLILRYPGSYPTPAGNYIAIQAPTTLSTGYAFTLPATLPSLNNSALVSSTSGSISYLSPDGIGQAMTSVGANAVEASRTISSTGVSVPIGGVATSPSCGFFSTTSTSFVSVTNLQIAIAVSGRPVMLMIVPDGSADSANFTPTGGTVMSVGIVNTNTNFTVGIVGLGAVSASYAGNLMMLDTSTVNVPGTYNYTVEVKSSTGSACLVQTCSLFAYEI
jgi:hypothetical protein